MKFSAEKSIICDAVINVSKCVSSKSTIPALEGVKMMLNGNSLEVSGYNLEIGSITKIAVNSDDSGECVINARLLSDIIRKMPDGEIHFQIDDNLNAKISCHNTEYDIQAYPTDEYPDLPRMDEARSFSIPQSIIKSMIDQTLYAVAQTDLKPILTGELFDIKNSTFNLVAIDGYRLAIRTEKLDTSEDFYFVVPSKALAEVVRLLIDDDEKLCQISSNKKHVMFDMNGYSFFARLLEGDFHNYNSTLFSEFKTEVIVNARELADSLDRCALLISDKHKAPVECRFESGVLHVDCKTGLGRVSDEMSADLSGDSVNIGFNNRYLADALRYSQSDKVKLHLNGSNRPVKVLPLQGDSFTFLLMPIALK